MDFTAILVLEFYFALQSEADRIYACFCCTVERDDWKQEPIYVLLEFIWPVL